MKKTLFIVILSVVLIGSVFIFSSCTAPRPKPVSQLPPPQQQQSPHGMQSEVDPSKIGTPTVVPKGETPDRHIKKYYDAYKAKKWEEAYELLPAVSKAKETVDQFKQSRSQMMITDYSIGLPVETQEGGVDLVKIPVDIKSSGMEFTTTWIFEKQKDGSLIVKQTQTSMGGN